MRILAFAIGSTLLAGLIFGFLPSFIAAHSNVAETLKEGGRASSARKGRGMARSAFVVMRRTVAADNTRTPSSSPPLSSIWQNRR